MSNLIDFSAAKAKKSFDKDMSRGRTPLYTSHINTNEGEKDHIAERMTRIRSSIDKINTLMAEVKAYPKKTDLTSIEGKD